MMMMMMMNGIEWEWEDEDGDEDGDGGGDGVAIEGREGGMIPEGEYSCRLLPFDSSPFKPIQAYSGEDDEWTTWSPGLTIRRLGVAWRHWSMAGGWSG